MLTVEKLREYGAAVDEGLTRCMNNEGFYLRLVKMELQDRNFDLLEQALQVGDETAAFEAAHALKGALGNLSLMPIFDPTSALTEELRARTGADYQAYFEKIRTARETLSRLAEEA